MPDDIKRPDQAIVLPFAGDDVDAPRVILLTSRGPRRTMAELLNDIAIQLQRGMADTTSEHLTPHTMISPGSIVQIYCGPTRPLPKRQPQIRA